MKIHRLIGISALFACSLVAADSSPEVEVAKEVKLLGEQGNYSWRTTVVLPPAPQFRLGPTRGKTEKDGFTHFPKSKE